MISSNPHLNTLAFRSMETQPVLLPGLSIEDYAVGMGTFSDVRRETKTCERKLKKKTSL